MGNVRHYFVALCLASMLPSSLCGQNGWHLEEVSTKVESKGLLDKFLDDNPKAIEIKILSEGTMAYLCANDSDLFVRVSVGNPMLFMRMLMQGLTLRIDPTGGEKSKYEVIFPSARDVQKSIGGTPSGMQDDRPDIGPLVQAMNRVGVVFDVKGKPRVLELSRSLIELDTENEVLSFYVLIPKSQMMEEKKLSATWSLGIYLESPIGVLEGPRDGGNMDRPQRPGSRSGRTGGTPDDKEMEKLMKKKINVWERFSIDEAYSINLK